MFTRVRADPVFEESRIPLGLTVRQQSPFLVVQAKDDGAFLNALSPVTGFAGKHHHRAFIYRGQASSTWPLVPASRRKEAWPPLFARWPNTLQGRLATEAQALIGFCDIADYQGLRIPNLSSVRDVVRTHWHALALGNRSAMETWPPHGATPALALAQHSGLRTCLLDFTRNPFVGQRRTFGFDQRAGRAMRLDHCGYHIYLWLSNAIPSQRRDSASF
jgi:hypothetical protein